MTYINPCLALYAVGTIGAAIIVWFSPAALKRLAARLLARSDLIPFIQDQREQRREKKAEYLAVRLREVGVESDPHSVAEAVGRADSCTFHVERGG